MAYLRISLPNPMSQGFLLCFPTSLSFLGLEGTIECKLIKTFSHMQNDKLEQIESESRENLVAFPLISFHLHHFILVETAFLKVQMAPNRQRDKLALAKNCSLALKFQYQHLILRDQLFTEVRWEEKGEILLQFTVRRKGRKVLSKYSTLGVGSQNYLPQKVPGKIQTLTTHHPT